MATNPRFFDTKRKKEGVVFDETTGSALFKGEVYDLAASQLQGGILGTEGGEFRTKGQPSVMTGSGAASAEQLGSMFSEVGVADEFADETPEELKLRKEQEARDSIITSTKGVRSQSVLTGGF